MRSSLAALLLLLAGCGSSPCDTVCKKLASCSALTSTEAQCVEDCEKPSSGHTCANEDAIASCFNAATCDQLTSQSSTLQCPSCQ